ncbi:MULTISPECIES: cupin domain-containing protein [Pseudomonas]|uniref:ChrR Cupin-like domain-containing protein n=1 Tax=Pseudomonas segetis TaxID=298908 RepID=A0A239H4U3_9PSED|nr:MULTISPECIES: cupin domain-containing protein [Pseudomonas]SNS76439.1 ChrR Cupin-like domain-containing protein [Pseudomonas segetis]
MSNAVSVLQQPSDWLPLNLPGAKGVSIKVYKADPVLNRVIVRARFEANSQMPRHLHHCYAVAVTLSGSWDYDDGHFEAGEIAYEDIGNDHVAYSEAGSDMIITFDSPSGQFIDNFLEDGTIFHLGMRFFQAVEGISLGAYEQLDLASLIDILPAARPAIRAA